MSTDRRYRRYPKPPEPAASPAFRAHFETGANMPRASKDPDWWAVFDLTSPSPKKQRELLAVWQEARPTILADWLAAEPGSRPWFWWRADAPPWTGPMPARWRADWFVPELKEPRRRLGGTGTAEHDCLNQVPEFDYGIPRRWISQSSVDHYNGRGLAEKDRACWNRDYHEGHFPYLAIDPANPPVFESEAAYLQRHELLSDDERRRQPLEAFTPERVEEGDAADE